jgi:phage terminase small subunit
MAQSKKRAAAKKKPRKLTAKKEAWTENYLANGFNGTEAARAAGYKGSDNTLAQVARENLRNPQIASRVRARIEGLAANSNEVLNLLGDHLRGSIADFDGCFNEDGSFNLAKAKEKEVAHLVKKLRSVRRSIPQGKDADGKDKAPIIETTVEIELYSSQDAAAKLIPVLGLKQKAGENEKDEERKRQWAAEQLEKVIARSGWDREAAIEWMRVNTPTAAQWIN